MGAAARLAISGPIGRHRLLPIRRRRHHLPHRRPQPPRVASVSVIEASLTGADIDATAAYVHGRDAVRWLQDRPIRSALIVWADGTTTRLPADLITNSQHE